jgi:lipopolysaccharide heptosyltransferase II
VKALVVCTGGGIGDALLATPCMRALRNRYSDVVALTAPAHRDVLFGNPYLSDVLVDDGDFLGIAERLRATKFDAAVVTWATLRTALFPIQAGIPVRVGQARRWYSFLFTNRVTVRSERGDHATHWSQILLDYARALNCDTEDALPIYAATSRARGTVATTLRELGIDGPYAVLHPTRGISAVRKRWPTEGLAELARALRAEFGLPVVVSGTDEDKPIADAVAAAAGGVSVAGRTSLAELGGLVTDAKYVVAMDSGPMHMAAAVGTPTVGIFALQSDEPRRWAPLGPRVAVVRGTYPCPPSHRKETCPDFPCVRALPVDDVLRAVRGLVRS